MTPDQIARRLGPVLEAFGPPVALRVRVPDGQWYELVAGQWRPWTEPPPAPPEPPAAAPTLRPVPRPPRVRTPPSKLPAWLADRPHTRACRCDDCRLDLAERAAIEGDVSPPGSAEFPT